MPDYVGTYKCIVLDTGLSKTKTGMPQFVVRLAFSEYWDQTAQEWTDVSDNNWVMNTYMSLYGRKDSKPDGELIETLNHGQICKVFGWDGCGPDYLIGNDFTGKVIQARIKENDPEYRDKNPVQVAWIDTEDADPNSGLQKLDAKEAKELFADFQSLWQGKKAKPVASAPKAAAPKTVPPKEEEAKPLTAAEKKKAMLEKSKRLREQAKPEAAPPTTPPPGKSKKAPPEPPAKVADTGIPADYGKKAAWTDIVASKSDEATDEQLTASWQAAIAETAPEQDEAQLDATGWWTVKEMVLNDIGAL
jgi:hypothetical protein